MKKSLWVCYRLVLKNLQNEPVKVLIADDVELTEVLSKLDKLKLTQIITTMIMSELKIQRANYTTKTWLIVFRLFDHEILLPSGKYDCRQTIYDAVYEVIKNYDN